MPGLTIISTCYKEAGRPVVKIGMSEYPQVAKRVVTGPELASKAEINSQVDDLISQMEAARKEAMDFFDSEAP